MHKKNNTQLVIEALVNVLHRRMTQIYIYIFIQGQIEEIQKFFCGNNKFSQQDSDIFSLSIFSPCCPVTMFSSFILSSLSVSSLISEYTDVNR